MFGGGNYSKRKKENVSSQQELRRPGGQPKTILPEGPIPLVRRRVSSVAEHSSANPKDPGSIPGPVSYRGHGL